MTSFPSGSFRCAGTGPVLREEPAPALPSPGRSSRNRRLNPEGPQITVVLNWFEELKERVPN